MAVLITPNGDVILRGDLIELTGLIVNADIKAAAGIAASKCQRGPVIFVRQTGEAVTETIIALFCKGLTGTVKNFTVSNLTANGGAATVTVDLRKNGVTMLSAVVTLDSTKAAFSANKGTLSVVALADGDYLTVVITAIPNGTDALASGVFAQIQWDEDYLQ